MKDLRIKRLTVHQYKWTRRDLTGDYNGFNHIYLKGGQVDFTDYVLTIETESGIHRRVCRRRRGVLRAGRCSRSHAEFVVFSPPAAEHFGNRHAVGLAGNIPQCAARSGRSAAALQFSMRDVRVASTVLGTSRRTRLEQTIALAEQPISAAFWQAAEGLMASWR